MGTAGTFELVENNSPDASGAAGRWRLSVDNTGTLYLTDSLGVSTAITGGGGGVWIHNAPIVVGDSPYLASVQETVKVDVDSGLITIQLPSAVGIAGIQIKIVSLSDSLTPNVCTILPDGAETINGDLSKTLTTPRERMTLESDDTNWLVVD